MWVLLNVGLSAAVGAVFWGFKFWPIWNSEMGAIYFVITSANCKLFDSDFYSIITKHCTFINYISHYLRSSSWCDTLLNTPWYTMQHHSLAVENSLSSFPSFDFFSIGGILFGKCNSVICPAVLSSLIWPGTIRSGAYFTNKPSIKSTQNFRWFTSPPTLSLDDQCIQHCCI